MSDFRSFTTRRLHALEAHRAAMDRVEGAAERRLRAELRLLYGLAAAWGLALGVLWLWTRVA